MTPLLWRALLRHPLRHPWQLGLAILGIALGVAVVLAVDLANASARRSFALAMERISGQATHRLVGDAQGIPEAWYVQWSLRPTTISGKIQWNGWIERGSNGLLTYWFQVTNNGTITTEYAAQYAVLQ